MSNTDKTTLGGGGNGTPANCTGKKDSPQSPVQAVRPSFPFPERQVAGKCGVHVRLLQKARQGLRPGEHWAIALQEIRYSQTGLESIAAALDLPSDSLIELLRKNPPEKPLPDRRVTVLRTPRDIGFKNPRMLHCVDSHGEVWVRIEPSWAGDFKKSQKITATHCAEQNLWRTEKPRKKART